MSQSGLAIYAEIALVLFFIVFVVVVARIFTSRRADVERHARLPLEDDPPRVKETNHG
jgi:cbb3-type cytochrome oxidase subunit 3